MERSSPALDRRPSLERATVLALVPLTLGLVLLAAAVLEALAALGSGLALAPNRLLAPAGALLAGGAWLLWRTAGVGRARWPAATAGGAVAAGGLAAVALGLLPLLVGGALPGRSRLLVAALGALAVAVGPRARRWAARLGTGPVLRGRWARLEVPAGVALALVFGWVLVRLAVGGGPFGHDEAVYALKARAWVFGTPDTGYGLHRGPLLPALGVPIVLLTTQEAAFRLVGAAFGVAGVGAAWALGRRLFGSGAGLIAAAALVAAPSVQRRAAQFLTDLPAAVLLALAALVLWRELEERPRPGWGLVGAALLGAGAFYLRFGSLLPIGLLALTALWLWRDRVRSRPAPVLVAGGVFGLLLVPHALEAVGLLGAPWALVAYTSEVAGREYLGQGLLEYLRWFPVALAGPAAGAVMVAGVVGGGLTLLGGPERARRAQALLLVPALSQVVLLGITAHGEPRFVFFPILLLLVAGGGVLVGVLRRLDPGWAELGAVAGAVVLLSALLVTSAFMVQRRAGVPTSDDVVAAAGERIRAEAGGSCGVLTSYAPQITWYSGCATFIFRPDPPAELPTEEGFLLLFRQGKRQPEGEALAAHLERAEFLAVIGDSVGTVGDAELYRWGG